AAGAVLRERFVIVNADDLGLSAEVDRGIFEAHDGGIVTSASLLVDGPDAGRRYRVPVRGFSDVVFLGRFWGQPEFGKTDMSKISVEALLGLLRSLRPGVSEVSCHPGRLETRPDAIYTREREAELSTLTDERVKTAIADEGVRLISYRDYARLRS